MSNKKEEVKKKIQWYCRHMGIPEPRVWDYVSVRKTSDQINKHASRILVCKDCGKMDVSYEHSKKCDPEYEQHRAEAMEYYD